MASKIKVVAIDMDHTLLDSEFRLNIVDANAVKRLKDSGIVIIIATGRMLDAVRKIINSIIDSVDYAVCYNGALVYDLKKEKLFYSCMVPWGVLYNMYKCIDTDTDIYHMALFSLDQVYVAGSEEDEMIKAYKKRTGAKIQEIKNIEMIKDVPVHKYLVYKKNIDMRGDWINESESEVYSVVKQYAGVELNVIKTRLGYVECINKNVSKWASIKKILSVHDFTDDQVMCIGDGYNDIDMVKYSGFGVAVDNAIQELKDAADIIVSSNNSCGVAEAINIVLQEKIKQP